MSYQGMLNWNSLSDAKKYLNVLTPKRILDRFDPKKFGMIKLNGSVIISSNAQNNPLYLCELQNADQVQNNLIELLRAFYFLVHRIDEYKIELYFSWENPSFLQQSNLREFLKPIEVLVIIGYSFPFFNRKSDSKIFQYLQNLKKIYIQNPRAAEVLDEINQIYTPGAHGKRRTAHEPHTVFVSKRT